MPDAGNDLRAGWDWYRYITIDLQFNSATHVCLSAVDILFD